MQYNLSVSNSKFQNIAREFQCTTIDFQNIGPTRFEQMNKARKNSTKRVTWMPFAPTCCKMFFFCLLIPSVRPYIHTIHYITLHIITLHYITLHYSTLHYINIHTYIHTCMHACMHACRHKYTQTDITLHYITLHYIAIHYITWHDMTLHYITSDYIALHYTTYMKKIHYTALHYITLD